MSTTTSARNFWIGKWYMLMTAGVWISGNSAFAQVVQLPTYRSFSMSGGVVVPDGGTGYLGGSGNLSQGNMARGGALLSNQAVRGRAGLGGVTVSVEIIDLDALDEAILSANVPLQSLSTRPNNRSTTPADDADQARRFISGYRTVSSTSEPQDYRDYQRALFSATDSPPQTQGSLAESNIRYYLKKGQEAEKANRIQSARVFYRMAREAMTPELLDRYQRILAERDQTQKTEAKAVNPGRKPF